MEYLHWHLVVLVWAISWTPHRLFDCVEIRLILHDRASFNVNCNTLQDILSLLNTFSLCGFQFVPFDALLRWQVYLWSYICFFVSKKFLQISRIHLPGTYNYAVYVKHSTGWLTLPSSCASTTCSWLLHNIIQIVVASITNKICLLITHKLYW